MTHHNSRMSLYIFLIVFVQSLYAFCSPSIRSTRIRGLYSSKMAPETTTTTLPKKKGLRISEIGNLREEVMEAATNNMSQEQKMVMEALRGRGLNDDDNAASGVDFKLIDIDSTGKGESGLIEYYDPIFLQNFFKNKPLKVAKRLVQVATTFGEFIACSAGDVILDSVFNRDDVTGEREVQRAIKLREAITSLGPFYIKLGQALSIRPDILSPRSMVELQKLCDKVPSFPSDIAFETIKNELRVENIGDIYSDISEEPVAAASLGQVYKATLKSTGETVAVKVQRPGVLETVSLDLFLFRTLGSLVKLFPQGISSRLDVVGLLDEFAFRFYQELDYINECANGEKIREQMKVLPNVLIPKNYREFTSRKVHTAEWVEGEKLSQSGADDVGSLVNLGVITYLTQLLEFGFFHADPHPGNMLRSPDGRLCVLDFGLMTEITEDQQYGMVEAIVHLLQRDYEYIGQDFINLGFIPPGTDVRPIVPALTQVFDAALAGGGAKSINFSELAESLAEITFRFPFKIPPYFALIIRAISVLEGIALVGNPEFAIIDEAFPYIAKRLLTADSPRLKSALRYLVYGSDGIFDAQTLIDVLQALEKFTAIKDDGDGSAFKVGNFRGGKDMGEITVSTGGRKQVDTTELEGTRFEKKNTNAGGGGGGGGGGDGGGDTDGGGKEKARSALTFFFSPSGKFFRDFMQEEIANVADSYSRELLFTLGKRLGIDPSEQIKALPGGQLLLPGIGLLNALNPPLSDVDKRNLKEIETLLSFLGGRSGVVGDGGSNSGGGGINLNDAGQKLLPVVSEFRDETREFVSKIERASAATWYVVCWYVGMWYVGMWYGVAF